MATTVHEPPVVDSGRPPGQTASGNGGRRNWLPAAGNLRGVQDSSSAASLGWLYLTLGLGLMFVGGQYEAWLQLKAQGLYLATNPSSSFFYVLTSVHVLHVLGGLGGLTLVITRLSRRIPTLRRSTLDTAS